MSDIHLGVDSGLYGGLAALSPIAGIQPISITPMPLMKVEGKPQMNVRALVQWVLDTFPHGECHVWIEKCPKHARSQAGMRSQGITYGRLLGIFEARFPHMIVHRVRCGRELAGWQRSMLGSFTAETSKTRALEVATELWPEMEWPRNRNEVVRDGIVDACLIAEFGRRQIEGS